ncbi:DUF3618 domain-containing protein [Micromonospora sp. U56]|uniref:DUF3618 domain-containing protein n=1 Tax=Micromonospora sp. U56 TaxID=2824900 RepID=UPI001B36BD5F|nr:DUF3618 domain-containing protein [Micromonospora sp. U56]MBQ0893561.1 DUF3618 domain-containing protein [Micromonospora sp. U56]
MSTDPDRIRYDIEAARAELSSDVDALTDRVNPRRIAAAPVNRARGRLSRMVDAIMGNARHARDVASQQASGVTQRASATTHRLSDTTQHLTGTAQQGAATAGDRARGLTHASRERAEGNPLAAGLIAFGVGALASSLLPPSRKERELAERAKHQAMEHSDQFKQQASGMMHGVQDNLREPVQQATEQVRSTAAQGVASVRDTGVGEAQHIREDAREAPRRW